MARRAWSKGERIKVKGTRLKAQGIEGLKLVSWEVKRADLWSLLPARRAFRPEGGALRLR
jgi:hypothetical protein